jgi:hypothetical protein
LTHILNAQVTILLSQLPANTPTNANIYIGGDFNNWNPAGNQLQPYSGSQFIITLNNTPAKMEFKFTRGNWNTVEGDTRGCEIADRSIRPAPGDTLRLKVASWKDLTPCNSGGNSTANEQMAILDPAFDMPQLGRQRKIWIYLPPDYQNGDRRYPVLYMHDGQNLFDRSTAFAGEWGVDETLTRLFGEGDPGIIVIGIDNGGAERLNEYSPWFQQGLGGGAGRQLCRFSGKYLKALRRPTFSHQI